MTPGKSGQGGKTEPANSPGALHVRKQCGKMARSSVQSYPYSQCESI